MGCMLPSRSTLHGSTVASEPQIPARIPPPYVQVDAGFPPAYIGDLAALAAVEIHGVQLVESSNCPAPKRIKLTL